MPMDGRLLINRKTNLHLPVPTLHPHVASLELSLKVPLPEVPRKSASARDHPSSTSKPRTRRSSSMRSSPNLEAKSRNPPRLKLKLAK